MLDVLQTMKDEILTDELIRSCKDLVEKTLTQTTIVFVCNTKTATRHLMTIPSHMMFSESWRRMIRNVALRAEADAISTIITSASVDDERCMSVIVETVLDRYGMLYPYDRVGHAVSWREPMRVDTGDCYGDLIPAPAGMAQA